MAVAASYQSLRTNAPRTGGERRYSFSVRDLPDDERPREKLIAQGPAVLSTVELLAVILMTGTQKEGVLEMSARIMKEYGEKNLMSQKNAVALMSDLSLPQAKAAQIIACAELGRRFFLKNGNGAPTIRTAREAAEYVGDMRSLPKEHLRGIYLNAHYKVIHDEVISIGTVDESIIHPREVYKPALEYGAAALILVHNHPSGIVAPSSEDIAITEQIISAGELLGITLVDHIIVTKDEHASIPAAYRS